ncbi:hypothetical protein FQA39_LY18973 [Lamprigera yunnana]|nr:hypothetical protein FQA39_LY18973 [Lamprigera yunnana]
MPPEQEDKPLVWPYWPIKLRTSSSHEEGALREFAVSTKQFGGDKGKLKSLTTVQVAFKDGKLSEVPGTEKTWPADLVLLAMGFTNPVASVLDAFGVDKDMRGNAKASTDFSGGTHPMWTRYLPQATCAVASRGGMGDPRRPPGSIRAVDERPDHQRASPCACTAGDKEVVVALREFWPSEPFTGLPPGRKHWRRHGLEDLQPERDGHLDGGNLPQPVPGRAQQARRQPPDLDRIHRCPQQGQRRQISALNMLSLPSTLTHAQANACLQQLQAGLAQLPAGSAVVLDASALAVFDSSALAVLLECPPQRPGSGPNPAVRLLWRQEQRRLDRRAAAKPGPGRQGQRQYAGQLSGGMKRRVLVAQALVHKPPIIVLDEPTAGVDVELRQMLWQFVSKLNKQGHTVLLTTHYLEEAEALCNRIAMLRSGHVVALSTMQALLQGGASNVLQFKTDGMLPAELAAQARITGRIVQVPAASSADVEGTAGANFCCRCRVEDLEIRRMDLEDVFLQVMARDASMGHANRPGGRRSGAMNGWQTLFYKEVLRFWKVSFQTIGAPVLTAVLYLLIFGHVLQGKVTVFDDVSYVAFLVPGLVMMSLLQNAFANSSSSLVQSKIMGSLVFILAHDAPLSHWGWFFALCRRGRGARPGRGFGRLCGHAVFCAAAFCIAAVGADVCGAGRRADGHPGPDRRAVGRQVRPDGRVPELRHRADDLPLGRVLLHPIAAAVLANRQPPEPVFLHDRRFSLRLFWPKRHRTVAQSGHRRHRLAGVQRAGHPTLLRTGYKIRN